MKHPFSPVTIQIFIICFLVFAMQQSIIAQTAKIDSLFAELETSKPDTNKVNILYYLSVAFRENEPDKAIDFAKQGISLSEKLKFRNGQRDCLNALGLAYYQKGNFDTALINFEKQYQIVSKMNDSIGIATTCDNMAMIYVHFGSNSKALELRKRANNVYAALNKKSHLASGYNWIGNIYKEQGEFTMALDYYLKALKIYEEDNDEQNIGYPLLNISSIYRYLKQFDQAINYAVTAKDKFDKADNKYGVGVSLYRLALIYSEESDYDNSIKTLNEAKILFEETQNAYFLALVNQMLGNCYRKLGNNDLAFNYFNSSFTTSKQLGDKNLISTAAQNIGTVYYDKGDFFKALEYMKKSETILKEINDKHALMKLSQNFIEIYSQLNKPDSVIKYFQNYVTLSDSLFSEQNSKSIAEMQTKYETEKKEKELEISTIKIEEQKAKLVLLIVFLVVMLVNGIIFYLLQRKNYKKNLLLAKSNLENRQLQEAEVKSRIRNNISDKAAKKILEKLAFEIETQKCYLEPELNINTLAQRTGTNREYLSQIIHKTYNKNFNEFVNYYRVYESVEILKKIVSDGHENWTMETVAEKSGFKYTSTFNPAFKSVMNMSPTEFKKALKNM